MFEVLGFILVAVFGIYLVAQGAVGYIVITSFTGKGEWALWITFIVGCIILYFAYQYSPIHMSITK